MAAVVVKIQGEFNDAEFKKLSATLDRLGVDIENVEKKAGSSFAEFGKKLQGVGDRMTSVGKDMSLKVTAPILAAGAALYKFSEAAAEDQQSATRLATALKNVAGATDAQIKSTEDWITKQSLAAGIADDDLRPAFERLTRSTGDIGEAQKMTNLAMEISKGTGKDLTTVANALAKANDGSIGALKKLGITLGDNAQNQALYVSEQKKLVNMQADMQTALEQFGPKSKEYNSAAQKVAEQQEILNGIVAAGVDWTGELSKQFGGALAADANTAAGQMARTKVAFAEATESLGYAFLPILEKFTRFLSENVVPMVQKVADWFNSLSESQKTAGIVIAGVVAAIGPLLVVFGSMASGLGKIIAVGPQLVSVFGAIKGAAVGLFNFLMAHPFVLIAAAVVALAIVIYQNWDTIKQFLMDTFNSIKEFTLNIWNGIKDFFTAYFEIYKAIFTAVFNAVNTIITTAWEFIKSAAKIIWNGIKEFFEGYFEIYKAIFTAVFNFLKDFITDSWNGIKTLASTVWNAIKDTVITAIQNLKTGVEGPLNAVKTVFSNIFNGIKDLVSNIMSSITGTIKSAINFLIRGVNTLISGMNRINISVPEWVPGVGGKSFGVNIPTIPQLAEGGIVNRPTLALIGEAGPEAVIPLKGKNAPGMGVMIQSGAVQITINGSADSDSVSAIERVVEDALLRLAREVRYA